MASTMWKDCRMRKMTSTEFRTLIQDGWPYDDLGSALVTFERDLAQDCLEDRHPNRTISPSDQAKLNLPMAKARGFQTVHCCTSRGLFQARQNWRIAATLAARLSDLPTVVQFATTGVDALDAGVDTKMVACIPTV